MEKEFGLSPVLRRWSIRWMDLRQSGLGRGIIGAAFMSGNSLLLNAISVPAMAFVIRKLGAFEYGQWATAASLVASVWALNNLGFSLYQAGNYRAAVDRLKRAAKLAPTDERILNNLGLALCRLGKFDDAFRAFSRASGPLNGNLNMASMLERFAREDDAIRYYEAARQIAPTNTIALRRLADLYERVGKANEAQDARVALANLNSGNGTIASLEK